MTDYSKMTKAELVAELQAMRDDLCAGDEAEPDDCRERLARYSSWVNDLPQLIFELNRGGRFTYFNDYALHILGLSAEDVQSGVFLADVIHPDSLDQARVSVARTLSGVRGSGEELFIKRESGDRFPAKMFTIGIRDNGDVRALRGVAMDMTEARRAERALRESEERYERVVRGTNDGIWDWDLTKDRVYYSPRYWEMLGYAPEEFPTKSDSWMEAVHSDDLERVVAVNEECISGKTDNFEVEFRMRHADGSYRWILGRGASVKNDVGAVYRLSGTHTDITRRKETERALMESERRYRDFFVNAGDGVYQCNPDGEFISANPAMARILGYDSPTELITEIESIPDQCYVDPEDRKRFLDDLRRLGSLTQYELRLKRRDGAAIWVSESARAIYDEAGELDYYEGFLQDITRRKLHERTTNALYAISKAVGATLDLKDLYQTIHAIIDEALDAPNFFIGLYDEADDRVDLTYFEDEKDDVYDIRNVSDPDTRSLTALVIRTGGSLLLTDDDILSPEIARNAGAVGTRSACWLGTPLKIRGDIVGAMAVQRYDDPKHFTQEAVAFMEAVSEQVALAIERKANEQTLTRLNEELELKVEQRTAELAHKATELQTANLRLKELDEIKSTLVSSISHELRTPLTSIRGFAKLASRDFVRHFDTQSDDPELLRRSRRIRQNLEIIETEGERLTRLINDFLDINRIESGKTVWNDQFINPCDIIRRASKAVAGAFDPNKNVTLTTDLPQSVPPVHADPDKALQVLINLLNNAVKFTREGEVRVSVAADADALTFTVADTGVGIPQAEIDRIFEKFHKVYPDNDESAKGTGLGLAICKEIVEHYGGKIWVESVEGEGSAFHFTLPAVPGAFTSCV